MIKYLFLVLSVLATEHSFAKSKKKKEEAPTTAAAPKEEKKGPFKSISEVTENLTKLDGLFPMYQDSVTGKSYIEVKEDQLGKEFIYFMYVLDGVTESGYHRGAYRANEIISFHKAYDKIEIKFNNTKFYFDPNSELSKAAKANINEPLIAAEKIQGMTVDKDSSGNITAVRYLIEADGIFLTETLTQIKPSRGPNTPPTAFSLGNLSSKKTKYLRLQNYPANTDVEVEYVYDNPSPLNHGSDAVTDARSVSVKVRHTLIEVPLNDYSIRYDDPRVGYFIDETTELTSVHVTPYKDKIHRWHLVKKDSNAALSEPVEPIVFWIENTTPAALRPIIKDAVERWNIAFEEAGFKNAIICNIQPDTADWDAGDIRYNVIRWTSSPNPPFGGYGPSFTNPKTGQILGADIMLEWIYLSNRKKVRDLFEISGLNMEHEEHDGHHYCSAGMHHANNLAYGQAIMEAYNFDEIQKDTFLVQCLIELVLHEVGHTLGLNHNFAGSYFASNDQYQDKAFGEKFGISSSVMDYNIPNISPDKNKQGLYFTIVPGLYDRWAIKYGYTTFATEEEEKEGLKKILAESNKREHLFFNDADDMRSIGKGTDPRAMLYDMTSDPITYAIDQIKMNVETFKKLKSKFVKDNQSYHDLRTKYLLLSSRNASNFTVLSRWIGGVFINRSFAGQDTVAPFTNIPVAEQKRAMKALAQYVFAPNAFDHEREIYSYLQSQRRGFNFYGDTELPKIHSRILNTQSQVIKQILHPATMEKIVDTKLYGNQYDLNAVLSDLTDAIVKEDISGTVNSIRQQLQIEYVKQLLETLESSKYSNVAKSAVLFEIQKIKRLAANVAGDNASKAHKQYLIFLIDQALEKK